MINRKIFAWMLRFTFLGVLVAHAYYLIQTGRGPGSNPDLIALASFLWTPVASGVSAASLLFLAVEKWLWRFSMFRGWLVLVPDLTGTWLARSVAETFKGAPHYSVVTIDHQFDKLTYRTWRNESVGGSSACTLERIGQTLNLFVFYRSHISMQPAEYSSAHDGSMRLQLLNERDQKKWILEGEYWTNKQRIQNGPPDQGTVGKITMSWSCRTLEGESSELVVKHLEDGKRAEDEHRQRLASR